MDINWFVKTLKNGEVYTAYNDLGEPYEVCQPPTSQSIKAAKFIEQLHQQLEQSHQTVQNLHSQVQGLIEYVDQLQNLVQPQASA